MGSIIRLAPAMDKDGNAQREFDINTQETLVRYTAAILDEDFIGPGHTSAGIPTTLTTAYPWVAKITGAAPPTVAPVANAAGGVIQCALTAASQIQEAILYAGDVLNWDATKSATLEVRAAMSVIPTGTVAEAVIGLHSAYVQGPDNTTVYIDFQMLASGLVNVRIKDGVSSAQSFSSGVTLVASAYHNFRFDLSDPTNVQFFIDGVRANPATPKMTFAATGATAIMQPYMGMYKSAATDVGTMLIDSVQLGMNRS